MSKKNQPTVLWILVVATVLGGPHAARAENPFYLFGKIGSTEVDVQLEDAFDRILDGDDDSRGYGLGARFGDHLVFELQYQDFGEVPGFAGPCDDTKLCVAQVVPVAGATEAYSLSFLPHWPLSERFSVYGKIGVVSWETELSEVLPDIETRIDTVDDEDLVYGAGLRFLLPGPFGVFLEFERFADSFETLSAGATWGF